MTRNIQHVSLDEFALNIGAIFESVAKSESIVLVEASNGDTVVLKSVRKKATRSHVMNDADYQAFLSASGSWADFDVDTFINTVYESRAKSSRPRVDL